ncbi:MAG: efflux RND transporter periplasmic adaptor subunit [Gammaproteobacteria bacterium]
MLLRLFVVVVLLSAVFGGIFGWKYYQQQQAGARQGPPPPATVAHVTVKETRWQPELKTVGTLVSSSGIDVTAEVSGVVREILFESGEPVAKGEVLLRLDDAVDQAELLGLVAEQNLARIKYRRLATLVKERSVSQSDVDEAKAELDNSTAQVASKQAIIEKKTIRAPFDGQLGIRSVDVGEFVQPGAALVPLQSIDRLYADFTLPERHLPALRVGQQVKAMAAAAPGRAFSGSITAMNPGIDVATRTIKLRAVIPNPERLLRPGMFVEVGVEQPVREGVVTIPRAAVSFAPYGDSVFLIEEQDGRLTVQRQAIQTGAVSGDEIEVTEGLAPGQRVVLAGQVKLRNGQAVQLDNSVVPTGEALGK